MFLNGASLTEQFVIYKGVNLTMTLRRDKLIENLKNLQKQFPEFIDILEEVIQEIKNSYIGMGQEDDYW